MKLIMLIEIKKINDLRTCTLFFKLNFQLMMTQVYLNCGTIFTFSTILPGLDVGRIDVKLSKVWN